MEVLGNIPALKVFLSEDVVDTLLQEAASYVGVASKAQHAAVAVAVPEQQSRKELFHRCSIQQADQLMDCHVMEITDQVKKKATSLCRQAMESGLAPR